MLSTTRKSYPGHSAWHTQATSLLPSAYSGRSYAAPAQNHTPECRLHGKNSQVGNNFGGFRTSVKGQVLADLVAEFTEPKIEELPSNGNMDEKLVGTISQYCLPTWEVHVDGASNQNGSGVGLVLMSPEMVVIEKSLRLDFPATNNEAEYEALLEGMAMVQRMGGKSIKLFSDSRLVVDQVKGEFETKDERMQGYLSQVKSMQSKFDSFDLLHVPKSGNAHADSLAMLATSST